MEPSAEEKVLVNIPETLDAIFQFLDPKNLVKCRRVCRRWRAVSNIQMKRRLTTRYFDTLYAYCGTMLIDSEEYPEIHKVKLIGFEENCKDKLSSSSTMADEEAKNDVAAKCQKPDETEMQCLAIQDASSPAAVAVEEDEHELSWRKVKPMPWFMSTVLQVDWLPSVEKLVLDRCLTVDDWNAAANAILAKFPALKELHLWLPQDRNSVLPLVYADLMEEEKKELPSLKKVLIQYYFCFNWTRQSQRSRPRKKPVLRGFQLENVEWTSGANWEFLKQCPSLEYFNAWIYFGNPYGIEGHVSHANIEAARSVSRKTVQEEYGPWILEVSNDKTPPLDSERDSTVNVYNSAFAKDIANLINTLQPAKLCIPLQPKLHSALASSKNTTNIQKLEFSECGFQKAWSKTYKVLACYVASVFKLAASFDNIQRLSFPYLCSPLDFEDITPLPPICYAKNLVTLLLKSSNDWMQQNLSQLMPNVQLLVFSYAPNVADHGYPELPKVLTLCSSFRKMKHLVILRKKALTHAEIRDFCVELLEHLTKCVNGLQSLTIIANLGTGADLELLTKQCLAICASTGSIRKLGVFSRSRAYKNKTEELDVSKLGFPIPGHLTVRAGSAALLGHGEAEFDGMDHSHVTWKELFKI